MSRNFFPPQPWNLYDMLAPRNNNNFIIFRKHSRFLGCWELYEKKNERNWSKDDFQFVDKKLENKKRTYIFTPKHFFCCWRLQSIVYAFMRWKKKNFILYCWWVGEKKSYFELLQSIWKFFPSCWAIIMKRENSIDCSLQELYKYHTQHCILCTLM